MKRAAFFFLFAAVAARVTAQPEQLRVAYSVDDCVEYALRYNQTLTDTRLDRADAQQDVRQLLARGYPQVEAGAAWNYNPEVQRGVIPANFTDPTAPEDAFVLVNFGTTFDANLALSLQQLVVDGTYFLGVKTAKQLVALWTKRVRAGEVDIAATVRKAYYTALVNRERLGLLDANLENVRSLQRQTKGLVEAGFAEEIDLDRINVSLNNLETDRANAAALAELSVNVLQFQMGMDPRVELILTDTLAPKELGRELLGEELALENRPETAVYEEAISLQVANIKVERTNYFPRLYLGANIRWNGVSNNFADTWKVRNPDPVRPTWFRTNSIGLAMTWTLFDGFKTDAGIEKARINKLRYETQFDNFSRAADLEVQQGKTNLANALRTLESQERNLELANKVFRVTQTKYTEGVGEFIDVITAENDLAEAQTNYSDAQLSAYIAKIDLQKALGLLEENLTPLDAK